MQLADEPSQPESLSWRKASLLRGPRALAALNRLTGSYSLHDLVEAYRATEFPRVVLGGVLKNADDTIVHAEVPAGPKSCSPEDLISGAYGPRRRIDQVNSKLLLDPELLLETTLSAVSDWPWSPLAHAARQYLFLEAENLDHAAQDLVEASAASWWWDSISRPRQVLLGTGKRPPDIEQCARQTEEHLEELSWRLPWGLVTSTEVGPRLPAARLADDEACYGLGPSIGCWRVSLAPDVRVYEIRMPSDWIILCERYPRVIEPPPEWARWGVGAMRGLCPDWKAVARDWDGLHVSMSGLLTTVGLPLAVGMYGSIFEDEIGSELTLWFRACFQEITFLTEFERHDHAT